MNIEVRLAEDIRADFSSIRHWLSRDNGKLFPFLWNWSRKMRDHPMEGSFWDV